MGGVGAGTPAAAPTAHRRVGSAWLWGFGLLPIVGVLVYAAAGRFPSADFFSIAGVGLLVVSASAAVGALLGFLFGLPRTPTNSSSAALLQTNTNLEQVSDWLTKILVGLGLVQLGSLTSGLDSVADDVATSLGNAASSSTMALALIIYSLIYGFVAAYIVTRLILTLRFHTVEERLALTNVVKASPSPVRPTPLPPPPGGGDPPDDQGNDPPDDPKIPRDG